MLKLTTGNKGRNCGDADDLQCWRFGALIPMSKNNNHLSSISQIPERHATGFELEGHKNVQNQLHVSPGEEP